MQGIAKHFGHLWALGKLGRCCSHQALIMQCWGIGVFGNLGFGIEGLGDFRPFPPVFAGYRPFLPVSARFCLFPLVFTSCHLFPPVSTCFCPFPFVSICFCQFGPFPSISVPFPPCWGLGDQGKWKLEDWGLGDGGLGKWRILRWVRRNQVSWSCFWKTLIVKLFELETWFFDSMLRAIRSSHTSLDF